MVRSTRQHLVTIAKLLAGSITRQKNTKNKSPLTLYFIEFRPHNICAKITAQNAQKYYVVRFVQQIYRIIVI